MLMSSDGRSSSLRSNTPSARVFRDLRHSIDAGHLAVGEQLPSELMLAQRFGVARATLRVALKRLQDEGLIQPRGRGRIVCGPSAAQPTVLSQTICLMALPPTEQAMRQRQRSGWEFKIQLGVTEAVGTAGLHALTAAPTLITDTQLNGLIAERIRGVIALREAVESDAGRKAIAAFRKAGIAVVCYGHQPEMTDCDCVASDHAAGAYALTRWLIDRGCRRIVRYWSISSHRSKRPHWLMQRDIGYERACREAAVEILPAIEPPPIQLEDPVDPEIEARVAVGYLAEHLVGGADAIMVVSDGKVPGVMAACRLLGRKPNVDLAVVGYDNYWSDLAETQTDRTPPLASVDKQNHEIGRALVELLLARLAGQLPSQPQYRLIAPRLVEL